MRTTGIERLNSVLRAVSEEIDVPPSKYREAQDRYNAVTSWLGQPESPLSRHGVAMYPQGSFALGTAVRPLGAEDYDVDVVCLLERPPHNVTQQQLKALVGDRLKHPTSRYREMIDPADGGRRCWTIRYADASRFHLDVLPAIPDTDWAQVVGVATGLSSSAIRITDRTTWTIDPRWPRSNPKGYALWFRQRMAVRLYEAKRAMATAIRAEVEQIQDYEVRTPLQRLIQLLKRHRDVRYNGNPDKPISIIITTLAAQAYQNEGDLADAILNVVPHMRRAVEQRNGVFWIPNPVNPSENFADKWVREPRKADTFFEWLQTVEQDCDELLSEGGWRRADVILERAFGQRDGKKAFSRITAAVQAPAILTPRKSEYPTTPRLDLPTSPGKPWRR